MLYINYRSYFNRKYEITILEYLYFNVLALVGISGLSFINPNLSLFYFQIAVLLVPLLYIKSVFLKNENRQRVALWVLGIPLIIIISAEIAHVIWDLNTVFLFNGEIELAMSLWLITIPLLLGSVIYVNYRVGDIVFRKREQLCDCHILLSFVLLLTAVLGTLLLTSKVYGFTDHFFVGHGVYLFCGILVLVMSKTILDYLRNPGFSMREGSIPHSDSEKTFSRGESVDEELRSQAAILEEVLIKDDLFLDPDLSLSLISQKTNIPAHQLSQIFNKYYNKGFYQIIGEYRIQRAMDILEKNRNLTFEAVAQMCGFNSTSTFYKHFKRVNNCTPYVYLTSLVERDISSL